LEAARKAVIEEKIKTEQLEQRLKQSTSDRLKLEAELGKLHQQPEQLNQLKDLRLKVNALQNQTVKQQDQFVLSLPASYEASVQSGQRQ